MKNSNPNTESSETNLKRRITHLEKLLANNKSKNILEREKLFRELLDSAPDAFLIVNAEGHIITFANEKSLNLFGYTRNELLWREINILIPDRYKTSHQTLTRGFKPHKREMGKDLDLYARRKDGTEFLADIMLGPIEYAGVTWVLCIVK